MSQVATEASIGSATQSPRAEAELDLGLPSWTGPGPAREHIWWRDAAGRLRVGLHAGQMRAHRCLAQIVLMLCGFQSGKTSYAPVWHLREIERSRVGDHFVASANYDLLKLKLLPEYLALFRDELGWEYRASDRTLVSGKKRIIFRSAEAQAGLVSATILSAVLDEWGRPEVGIEQWDMVMRGLSLSQGRVLIPTTPYNLGWLKVAVYDRAIGGEPGYGLVNFKSTENPWFPREVYERRKREMPSWRFVMFYDGLFTKPAGIIYEDYEDSYAVFEPIRPDPNEIDKRLPGPGRYVSGGNLVKPFVIPKWWLRTVGVDFGPVNTAVLWGAEDPVTHNVYWYREKSGGDARENAENVRSYKEAIRLVVGGAASEDDARAEWGELGVGVVRPFVDDLEPGIDRANSLFKQRRSFVFDVLTGLRSQLGTYQRELDGAGEPTEKIVEKSRFHLLDAYRYGGTTIGVRSRAEAKLPGKVPDLRSPAGIKARMGIR